MKTTGNTMLITGGSAGIGFEMARLFSSNGNKVIITGRDAERLKEAAARLENVTPFTGDVTDEKDVQRLVEFVQKEFPALDVLVNNAGYAAAYKLGSGVGAFAKAEQEMLTNYLSVIRLTEALLPILSARPQAAVVNVSSIVAFRPNAVIPTYSASKVAVHTYSDLLRDSLRESTAIEVYEVVAPLVNTAFSEGIGGAAGIHPREVAEELLQAMARGQWMVPVGKSKEVVKVEVES